MTVAAHPSATVVLLRDGASGVEVLLVQRSERLDYHGGAWVFPGGRVDHADYNGATEVNLAVARRAAAREVAEEVALRVDPDALVWQARWTTPEDRPKRFVTWFFLARATRTEARVDGGEISAARWLAPSAAIDARRRGEIVIPPPTFVTLTGLLDARSVQDALARAAPEEFLPRVRRVDAGYVSLYQQDASYNGAPLDAAGPRHRMIAVEGAWRYERSFRADSRGR